MRKLSLLLLASSALWGCSQEPDLVDAASERIRVELQGAVHADATTRVDATGFQVGDEVGVYVVNYDGNTPGLLAASGNQVDNMRYTYRGEATWEPDTPVYYYDRTSKVDVIGYYPYRHPQSTDAMFFEVERDQTTAKTDTSLGGYEASDLLWAKTEEIVPEDYVHRAVPLNFTHRMSVVKVVLKPKANSDWGDGEWERVEKSVLVCNTVRKAAVNLATGEVSVREGEPVPDTDIVALSLGEEDDGGLAWEAVVVPQTVTAGTKLFMFTVDGYSRPVTLSSNANLLANKRIVYTFNLSKATATGNFEVELEGVSISDWEDDKGSYTKRAIEYIVIECQEPGHLREAIEATGKDITKVQNLKVVGTINVNDFTMMKNQMPRLSGINLKKAQIAAVGAYAANEIPDYAFQNKSVLVNFVFPDGITRIGHDAFASTNLSGSLILPNTITEIGDNAFYCCSSLNGTLSLPNSLVTLESRAFYDCIGLIGTLNIPKTVQSIGIYCFSDCSGFTGELVLPADLTEIANYAFSACYGLSGSLTIPSKVTKIGSSAFSSCGFDGNLVLPQGLLEIGECAFQNCQFTGPLNLPGELLTIGRGAFKGCQFSGELKFPTSLMVLGEVSPGLYQERPPAWPLFFCEKSVFCLQL